MWIKNNKCIYNLDQFTKVYMSRFRIIGIDSNNEKIVLGEFWTKNECVAIFRSIINAIFDDEKFIIIKNTRDGMVCLKKRRNK